MTDLAPRLLTLREASGYLRISQAQLRRLGIGRIHLGATQLYDRRAIDAHLDQLHGLGAQSYPLDADDPEAAFDRSFGPLGRAPRSA